MANFSSDLTLYSGVKIDNTYENVLTSTSYLVDNDVTSVNVYTSQSNPSYYIRLDKNKVRITHSNMRVSNGGSTINLYRCNYLRFNNTAYENKSFYCFVTNVRYINDETAELDFEVDVFTTWVATGSAQFEECFIERKHTNDDIIGKYILEEPVDLGDYLYSQQISLPTTTTDFKIVVGVSGAYLSNGQGGKEWKELPASFHTEHNGQYLIADSLTRYYFDKQGNSLDSNPDFNTIQDLFTSLRDSGTGGKGEWVKLIYYTPSETSGKTYVLTRGNKNGNYTPKNKKLLTYPYYGLRVNNYEGTTVDYAFELGQNGSITFQIITSDTDGMASLIPIVYEKGSENSMLIKSKYPVMSSSSTPYDTYVAQLKAQAPVDIANIATPAITGALFGSSMGGFGGIAGAAIGAGVGLISYITKALAGGEQAKLKGSTPIGNNSGILQLCNGTAQFGFYFQYLRPEYAKAIDNFFTRFGYKVNTLEIPRMTNNRFNYHYIKTIGCAVKGHIPSTAQAKIQQVMDNGVTFWNTSDVGNYS